MFLSPDIKKVLTQDIVNNPTITKSSVGTQAYLAKALLHMGKDVVVLLPDLAYLKSFSAIFRILNPGDRGEFWEEKYIEFPSSFLPSNQGTRDWGARWSCLFKLKESPSPKVVACSVDNLLPFWPPKTVLDTEYYLLSLEEEIEVEELINKLIDWGYERVKLTTSLGEISKRGDVLDVFVPGYGMPIRIEFFGDIVESIRTFDPITQRSKENLDSCVLLPVSPHIGKQEFFEEAKDIWNYLWKIGLLNRGGISYFEESLSKGEIAKGLLPGIFYPTACNLSDYFSQDAVFLLVDPEMLRRTLEDVENLWKVELNSLKQDKGVRIPVEKLMNNPAQAKGLWIDRQKIIFDSFAEKQKSIPLPEQQYYSFTDLFWRPEQKRRPISTILDSLKQWTRNKNQVVLCFHTQNSKNRFLKIIQERIEKDDSAKIEIKHKYHFDKKGVYAVVSPLTTGISLDWNHLLFLPESILFPAKVKSRGDRQRGFKGIETIDDIRPGDYLVHRDYGIGIFKGLTRIQVNDIGNDYLEMEYRDANKLFVPIDKLNLIQKYKGPDGITPLLDRLGSNNWSKTRARVKKAIEAIAQDLVKMYAYRKIVKGFKYPPIDEDFREFEATFPFDETPDQEKAIEDVLRDMEKDEPMDRLICGDVGFGKTEIAMRAAYRAVSAGRQVALLCPTTVLAEQHYRNFKARMEDFGVNVVMLSRFVPRSKQKKIIEAIKRGEIDVVIGTHRLLSNDLEIPRLGLFILDEEQRFGVRQKEKLKQMRTRVDVLTLTATPIPRTLQFSLAGIRGLSVIETPPVDRKPVETSIIERNRDKLKEILNRELQRNGQVFWVYNRVKGLSRVKDFVKSLVPHARVEIAHGQMSEKRLEDTLHSFLLGEIDVLVCTAIIEAGLDFPRANTLIVDTPQLFGLGQLYQLRGRVGRSKVQAYAYFVVNSLEKLPKPMMKRLKTILELDYLGAGFKVAMADLKLRGAGNLLGEAQTGNIAKVGLDLYLEMLEKEVKRLKGEKVEEEEIDPKLNIFIEANIPSSYIQDPDERMHYYKMFSVSPNRKGLDILQDELKDRFGPLPVPVINLMSILQFKQVLMRLKADRCDFYSNRVIVWWEDTSIDVDPGDMLEWIDKHKGLARLINPKKIELSLNGDFSKELIYWYNEINLLFN